MKYLVMIWHNPESRAVWESFSEAERAAGYGAYEALNEELAATGELVVTHALADPSEGRRVVRTEHGVRSTDGPYAEAKEFLAGFYLLECESLERAVELAGKIPEADLGQIEVRPVMEYGGSEM